MEKFVFRAFMNYDVIRKCVILADAFNLTINDWKSSNSTEHPYRIVFYNNNMIVGYIDAKTYCTGDINKNDMPFVLFTPFGKLVGYFSTQYEFFKYDIYGLYNRKNPFERIDGMFSVKKYGSIHHRKYHIASTLTLRYSNTNHIQVSFNRMGSIHDIDISKATSTSFETVKFNSGSYVTLHHYDYPLDERRNFVKMGLELKERADAFPTVFEFLNRNAYQKDIKLKSKIFGYLPYRKKLGLVDFDAIAKEISENDPRMFSFIDEVRNGFTLLANGITPVSIYDRMAKLCFSESYDNFMFALTRAKSTTDRLTQNPVLIKMKKYEQGKKVH